MDLIVYGTYFGLMGLIVLWDLRSGKIPNVLLAVFLLINFFFVESLFGRSESLSQVFGGMLVRMGYALITTVFLFPFFSIGALGAGDVKLIAVASLGVARPVLFFLIVFAIGSFLGIVKLMVSGEIRKRAEYMLLYFRKMAAGGVAAYIPEAENSTKVRYCIHMSVPVMIALLILFLMTVQ